MIKAKLKEPEDIVKAITFLQKHKDAIGYLDDAGVNLEDIKEYQEFEEYNHFDPPIPRKKTILLKLIRKFYRFFNL